MKRVEFLGCPLDVATMDETVEAIDAVVREGGFMSHVVVNVAKLVHMRRDSELAASVQGCDLINADGMGIVFAASVLGVRFPERVAGVDLFERLVALGADKGYPVYFLGAKADVVARVAEVMAERWPGLKIAGFHHGYFWDDEEAVVEKIGRSGARLLFVAFGSPMKENFIRRWKSRLGVNFVMGVGGTFDVVAGKVRRAPAWMQKCGLEWLFRVIQEPRRMWKRYLVTNTVFGVLMLGACLKRGRSKRDAKNNGSL